MKDKNLRALKAQSDLLQKQNDQYLRVTDLDTLKLAARLYQWFSQLLELEFLKGISSEDLLELFQDEEAREGYKEAKTELIGQIQGYIQNSYMEPAMNAKDALLAPENNEEAVKQQLLSLYALLQELYNLRSELSAEGSDFKQIIDRIDLDLSQMAITIFFNVNILIEKQKELGSLRIGTLDETQNLVTFIRNLEAKGIISKGTLASLEFGEANPEGLGSSIEEDRPAETIGETGGTLVEVLGVVPIPSPSLIMPVKIPGDRAEQRKEETHPQSDIEKIKQEFLATIEPVPNLVKI